MQTIGFLVAGIVLHQSLTGHVLLHWRLTVATVSGHRSPTVHNPATADTAATATTADILDFRCGCGGRRWIFVAQQISLEKKRKKEKKF